MDRQTNHHTHPEEEEPTLSPTQLLQLAETHLRLRNFTLSHQYALESQSHPTTSQNLQRYATQLSTLSDILSATTNHYTALQLDTLSSPSPATLSSRHSSLLSLLTPLTPRIPLAHEAISLLHQAHLTLSDPSRKAHYDAHLAHSLSHKPGSFWTFCPYCFYLYEYSKAFEGCCLRCQNKACRRVFCGVEVPSLPPRDLEKGNYFGCFGYFPIGFDPDRKKGGSWSPLVGMFPMRRVKSRANRIDLNEEEEEEDLDDDCIEISSESEDYRPPRGMKRKSVARKMLTRRGRRGEGEGNGGEEGGGVGEGEDGGEDGMGVDDVNFFEDNGEIFVHLGEDDGGAATAAGF